MSDKINSLITNIPPPTELPTFVLQNQSNTAEKEIESPPSKEKFNPVIPIEKNFTVPTPTSTASAETPPTPDDPKNEEQKPTQEDIAQVFLPLTDGVKNSVIFGWMKDTVKSGLKSGMQITKESIDKVVTTLDPQMAQLIYSGGNTEIVVASSNDDKITSVREAFQEIFGRATVYGHKSHAKTIANQPVGFENAELAAKERINCVRTNEAFVDKVIVSVENFIVEIYKNQWFDLGLIMLSDPISDVTLKVFTQMTYIPLSVIISLESETDKNYEKKETGYATTVGAAMGRELNTPHYDWHKTYTSIDRFDMIKDAAKSLASIYKRELSAKAQKKIQKDVDQEKEEEK
ncbi:CLUMA_CG004810, isoform A [Clunio marinus]|uniref:CLUMA_CG004810, isoform A n=1 Tax=Clunio marinus TaxID=568069 RepID=A0A1J1HU89_9DIPT|nr:CLUMA_CG004810, isoform A [Clunio marinus]